MWAYYKNGLLKQYIFFGSVFTEASFGENMASKKVSDDANDKEEMYIALGQC